MATAMESRSLGSLDFDALSGLQHLGDVVSPRCRGKEEVRELLHFALTPGRECRQSAPALPRRRHKVPVASSVHHVSTGDGPSGVLTHFYHIADDVEQLDSGAQLQRRHCQDDEVEHSAELAKFVRANESDTKSLRRESSVASSLTTFDDRSECSSSECRLFADAFEDTIWGEVFVTRIQTWYRGRASCLTRKEIVATHIQAWYRGCACRQRRTSILNSTAGAQVEEESAELEIRFFATRIQAWYRGCASRHRRKLCLEGATGSQDEGKSCEPDMEVFVTRIQAWYRGLASRQRRASSAEGLVGARVEKESCEPEMGDFAIHIQAWYRGCASRQTSKPSCDDAVPVHLDEAEPFEPDLDLFTSARMSTRAFEDKVRTRAYLLFVGGSCDERKNYFDALQAERKVAPVSS